jgi:LuxR family maltose regulon positive regulatory protein
MTKRGADQQGDTSGNDSTGEIVADWLLLGKLTPPKQHVTITVRTRLIEHLSVNSVRRLTILVSPPGFGKTTLLTQWSNRLAERPGTHASWLSLDEEDGEPGRFLAYLIRSISDAGVDLGKLAVAGRNPSIETNVQGVVTKLVSAIERQPNKLLIILDDYHRVQSAAVDAIVEMLIDKGTDKIHLAVSGRKRPNFHVSALNARGQVNYLDASDLALSEVEAQTILGPAVSRSDLALVHARTEGWAVALQLARLWLDRGKRSPDRLKDFSGQTAEMAEYLVEQVVNDLPGDLRDFVLETSILDRLNADLANSVRRKTDSAELLDRLANFNALLVPLDDNGNWYRFHHMFAEFLVQRLYRTSSARVPDLHRRAARWLAQHDLIAAIGHALTAEDQSLAIQIVREGGGWELVLSRGIGYSRNILKKFPYLTVRSELTLQLMQAYLDSKLGHRDKAMEMLRLAEFSKADMNPGQRRDLLVISSLVRCYLDEMQAPTFLSDAQQDLASLPRHDHLGRATVGAALVVAAIGWGDIELATSASLTAMQEMQSARSSLGANYILLHLAHSRMLAGNLREAQRLVNAALVAAEDNFGTESALKGIVGCVLAYSLYLDNQLEEADGWIERSLESIQTIDGWFDIYAAAYEILVHRTMQEKGLDAAMNVLEAASLVGRERNFVRLTGLTSAWRVELLAGAGHLADAKREAGAANLEAIIKRGALPSFEWRIRVAATIAMAKISYASGASAQAWHLLHQVSDDFFRAGLVMPARSMQAMGLLALREHPDDDRMLRDLDDCLTFIAKEGGEGIFLNCGPGIESVLQNALKNTAKSAVNRRAVLMSLLKDMRKEQSEPQDEFSASELNVLRQLRQGRPNKTIARTLDVSENTVKFHLKHIYRKLDVDSRSAAIAAAIDRNLLDS